MYRFYGIFQRVEESSFKIIYDEKEFSKKDLQDNIDILEDSIKLIFNNVDLSKKRFYLDIKDRFIFINLFLTLAKMNVCVVLVPIEINPEIYRENGVVVISDNKESETGLYINNNLELITGDKFSINNIYNWTNVYDFYLFTSGSTGKSKLIGKNSNNIVIELVELYRLFKPKKKSVFYFTPPLYHIYGILFGFLFPMFSEAIIDLNFHFSPESVSEYVKDNKIDYFISVPSYYKLFSNLNLFKYFKNVHHFFSSSAPLSVEISNDFFQHNIKITEVYGSTETGGIAYRCSSVDEKWNLFSYVEILNSELNVDKELIISSPAISVNYQLENGYNTGDLVHFHSNSLFSLLGRNTRFVKIHGKRLDLKFVESHVLSVLDNKFNIKVDQDYIVVLEKDEKIFVFLEINNIIDTGNFLHELKTVLPGYAIPKKIIYTKIPKNDMGKINKVILERLVES